MVISWGPRNRWPPAGELKATEMCSVPVQVSETKAWAGSVPSEGSQGSPSHASTPRLVDASLSLCLCHPVTSSVSVLFL